MLDGLKKLIFQIETRQRQQQQQQQNSVNLNGKTNNVAPQQQQQQGQPKPKQTSTEAPVAETESKVPSYSPTSSIYMRPMMEEPAKQVTTTTSNAQPMAPGKGTMPISGHKQTFGQPKQSPKESQKDDTQATSVIENANKDENKFIGGAKGVGVENEQPSQGVGAIPSSMSSGETSSSGNIKQVSGQQTQLKPAAIGQNIKKPMSMVKDGHKKLVDSQLQQQQQQIKQKQTSDSAIGEGGEVHSKPKPASSTNDDLNKLLGTISQRIHKLEEHLLYNRIGSSGSGGTSQAQVAPPPPPPPPPPPKYTPTASSSVVNLSPVLHNYLSLIKSQFLNIDNKIESKFSNIEHKFSNIEIEDGIWKKTINWKMEEMSSKVT